MYKAIIFDFFGVLYRGGPDPIDQGVAGLIKALRGHYKTGLLSNSNAGYAQTILDEYGVRDLFDEVTVSGEVGAMKPDPAIFHHALQQLGVAAGEAVFIDDSPANVQAAEALGIRSFVFTGTEALRRELAAAGIKVS
jgi:putative hydrolase of the HAD superfamily